MYQYHGSSEHARRLSRGDCRCQSTGTVYDVAELLRDGLLYDPKEMTVLFSTPDIRRYRTDDEPLGAGYGKTFIFAIDKNLGIHIAPDSNRANEKAVKHETLFHNEHVLAAGEICIKNGSVSALNDHSGSYKTDGQLETNPTFASSVLAAFDRHHLPITPDLREELLNLSAS